MLTPKQDQLLEALATATIEDVDAVAHHCRNVTYGAQLAGKKRVHSANMTIVLLYEYSIHGRFSTSPG